MGGGKGVGSGAPKRKAHWTVLRDLSFWQKAVGLAVASPTPPPSGLRPTGGTTRTPYGKFQTKLLKNVVKDSFELHFKLRAPTAEYHNRKTGYLNPLRPAAGCTFYLVSYFRFKTSSTYERVFRSCPVHKSWSICNYVRGVPLSSRGGPHPLICSTVCRPACG